jgi:acetylornithine deacetylase/succinyl-diaminopimelate desuccinylase-like protein
MDERRGLIEEAVRTLAEIERPSASDGERRAADWIARRLGELGAGARVEEERAHGGFWWPVGLANAATGLAAMRALRQRRRGLAALVGAVAAAALWDDLGGGRLWFRRRFLPSRPTWNVVAETGDRAGDRTVVFVAHHDAAHSGLVFSPALPGLAREHFGELVDRSDRHVPVLFGVWLGPVLTAAGALLGSRALLRLGALLAGGAAAAMADIGLRAPVPGANDNLSSVAVLTALAAALRERPVAGVRVLLVSTGSEESFMEGMQAFARRHFPRLPRDSTEVVCVECVGSHELVVVEGEGMLRMRDYPPAARDALAAAAADAGIHVRRGLRTVAATDGLIALRAGYPTATLGGIDPHTMFPSNYHWPTDTPDNLNWRSIEGAVAICEAFLRRRAGGATERAGAPAAAVRGR